MLERISIRAVIWLFVAAFILHDGEEVLTTERWVGEHGARLREAHPQFGSLLDLGAYTTAQFGVAVFLLLLGVVAVSWFAARAPRPGSALTVFTGAVLILFWNGLTHIGSTLLLGVYTPGVVTAVLVSLPYSVLAYLRLRQAGLLTGRTLRTGALWAILAAVPMLALVHLAGRVAAP